MDKVINKQTKKPKILQWLQANNYKCMHNRALYSPELLANAKLNTGNFSCNLKSCTWHSINTHLLSVMKSTIWLLYNGHAFQSSFWGWHTRPSFSKHKETWYGSHRFSSIQKSECNWHVTWVNWWGMSEKSFSSGEISVCQLVRNVSYCLNGIFSTTRHFTLPVENVLMKHSIAVISLEPGKSISLSPWDNRTGWLGVKH